MIGLFTRRVLDDASGRPTPEMLAKTHKRVRVTPHVITQLPNKPYAPRRCDGSACFHDHAGVSRQPQTRAGRRRWFA